MGSCDSFTVFLRSSLGLNFVVTVSSHDDISALKKKAESQHLLLFPENGRIVAQAIKIMREGLMFHLSDSMPITCFIRGAAGVCSLFMDAVTLPPIPSPIPSETRLLPDQHKNSMHGIKILSPAMARDGKSADGSYHFCGTSGVRYPIEDSRNLGGNSGCTSRALETKRRCLQGCESKNSVVKVMWSQGVGILVGGYAEEKGEQKDYPSSDKGPSFSKSEDKMRDSCSGVSENKINVGVHHIHNHKRGVTNSEIVEEKLSNGDKDLAVKKKYIQVCNSDDAAGESHHQLPASKKTGGGKEGNKKRKIDDSAPMDDKKIVDHDVAKKKKKHDKKSNKIEKYQKGSLSGVNAEYEAEAKMPDDNEKLKKADRWTGKEGAQWRGRELRKALGVEMVGVDYLNLSEKEKQQHTKAVGESFGYFYYKGRAGDVNIQTENCAGLISAQRQCESPPEATAASPPPSFTAPRAKPARKSKPRSQLTAAEKRSEAYLRVPRDFSFKPPPSCHHLLQEKHSFDPWRVLVICMLLNITTGTQVRKVLEELFTLCPDAETTVKVDVKHIENVIRSLGLQKKRAQMIKRFSEEYSTPDWTHVTFLHGIGKYAADAYAIFCTGMGADVRPRDHKLVDYWNFVYGKDSGSDISGGI